MFLSLRREGLTNKLHFDALQCAMYLALLEEIISVPKGHFFAVSKELMFLVENVFEHLFNLQC